MSTQASKARIVIVSGMSGAGKSTALKILEDLGYEAVDNLPLSLVGRLIGNDAGENEPPRRAIAIGIDTRTRDFRAETIEELLTQLRDRGDVEASLLFLECADAVLLNRFTATRRRHPLAGDRPVGDGIDLERRRTARLRDRADLTLDTTDLALPDFRRLLIANFALDREPGVNIMVISFSYRRGLPREADLVFDVRFLDNPHYHPDMRELTGEDRKVADFIAADPGFAPFFSGLGDLLLSLIPRYSREGKHYLTIAVGCTGGRHRSVYVATRLAGLLAGNGYRPALRHRDKDVAAE